MWRAAPRSGLAPQTLPPNDPLNLCMGSPWDPDCQLSWGWLPWRLLRVLEPAVGRSTEALSGLQELPATIPVTLHPAFVLRSREMPRGTLLQLGSQQDVRTTHWPGCLSCKTPHPPLLKESHCPPTPASQACGPRFQAHGPLAAAAGAAGWGSGAPLVRASHHPG